MIYNRIFGELRILYEKFKNISIKELSQFKCQIIIQTIVTFEFTLLSTYPFTMPEILINNKKYSSLLSLNPRYSVLLKKHYGYNCLCCNSLSCINNWTPHQSLIKIIDEFTENLKIKKKLIQLYFCKLIKEKYNCEFLYIEDYIGVS